jgi:anaerobic magnesium-protoporphyrin IX monomethyl ester cyclase
MMNTIRPDLVLINPGGREAIYQELGNDLTAIEPPLWCRLIGGYVRDQGREIVIIDSEAENMGYDRVAEKVAELNPKLVAMVVFGHQPSASTQQMASAGETASAIKANIADMPIIFVGGHVSALPEQTIREEMTDYVCKGEGPITVNALIDAIDAGSTDESLAEVPALVWMRDDAIVMNPAPPLIKDLDTELHGNVWDLLPMDKYRAHNWQCFSDLDARKPYASIYTSLGCPYKCVFCCINAPFDANRYRMRKPEAVVEEIAFLYETYGVKTFKIIDEMFVLNERHVMGVCDGIIERGITDLNIWAYARVDTVKPQMLEKLRKAGFQWLALGVESGSTHVRDGAEKAFGDDDIIDIVRLIQSAGINVACNFIFGLPDDDIESMQATLDLAKNLGCEYANFYSAMAYPGSPLYGMAVQNNWPLPETWTGFSQHSYDCTPLPTEKVSAAEVLKFRDNAFHDFFSDKRYLDTVTQRFGWDTRKHIEEMSEHRLRRRLVEELEAAE